MPLHAEIKKAENFRCSSVYCCPFLHTDTLKIVQVKMFKLFGTSKGPDKEDESQYGDDSFTETKVKQSGLLDDIKAIGPNLGKDALTLLEKVASTGQPYDDRTFLVR